MLVFLQNGLAPILRLFSRKMSVIIERQVVELTFGFLSTPTIAKHDLIEAMQSHFEVHVLEDVENTNLGNKINDTDFFRVALDLWLDGQPYATVTCSSFGTETLAMLSGANDDSTQFAAAARTELTRPNARRIFLNFDYWETEERASLLLNNAIEWAEHHIGAAGDEPLHHAIKTTSTINPSLKSASKPWAMIASLFADGDEAHAGLAFIRDVG